MFHDSTHVIALQVSVTKVRKIPGRNVREHTAVIILKDYIIIDACGVIFRSHSDFFSIVVTTHLRYTVRYSLHYGKVYEGLVIGLVQLVRLL